MAVRDPKNTVPSNHYAAHFLTFLDRAIEQSRMAVEATIDIPTTHIRKQALHLIGLGLQTPTVWPSLRPLLLAFAPKMEQAGYRVEWAHVLTQSIVLAHQIADYEIEIELTLQLGRLYEFMGKLEQAKERFTTGLALATRAGQPRDQGRYLGRLAFIAYLQRDHATATDLARRALVLIADGDIETARIYAVLGAIAYDRHKWSEAIDHYRHALYRWEQANNMRMIAWSLRDLGTAYRRSAQLDTSIACYTRALTLFAQITDPVHEAMTRMNLGNVYLDQKQPALALELYEVAMPVFTEIVDPLRLARLNNNIGLAYRDVGRYDEAIQAFHTSCRFWRQLGNQLMLADVLAELGVTYAALQMNEKAIELLKQAKALIATEHVGVTELRCTIDKHLHCLAMTLV